MLLRDFLNEFELDWAQAAVRSELISGSKLKGAKVLLIGEQAELQKAAAWSFMAWNDSQKAGIRVMSAAYGRGMESHAYGRGTETAAYNSGTESHMYDRGTETAAYGRGTESAAYDRVTAAGAADDGTFRLEQKFTEEEFAPEDADYVILSGFCCREVPGALETAAYLQHFEKLIKAVSKFSCKRVLLLSDGRVYGKLEDGFAASEYEAGATDPCAKGYEAQYFLQALEHIFLAAQRASGGSWNILRTGMIYGPCIPMMEHSAAVLAKQTAAGEEMKLTLSQERNSYISIHDMLTAVQFVLTETPANKIFNVSGPASNASDGELAMLFYNNFPDKCRITMTTGPEDGKKENPCGSKSGGIWLNTQLLEHYGFEPRISLEDGIIILVKSLMQGDEVFIFDNTYLGKLDKVQKILLGYLLEIDRICKKHDIKYFLAGGTLLGAIRHHGFIPWDDDADVMMLREDYDKFQSVVQQELPENIFLQLPHTEKGNYNPFTKLRINNTMFATEFTGHFLDMHNGIFFDVLSHDRTGRHKWSQKLHLMATMLTRSVVFNKWGDTDIKGGGAHPIICKIVDHAKYLIPMRLALWAQNCSLTFFKNRKTEYLYDGMGRNLKRGAFPAKWLDEAVYVDFEGYKFPVPKEYDKYLTYLYGDYMQMIPVSQRRTSHSIVLMDLGEYSGYTL